MIIAGFLLITVLLIIRQAAIRPTGSSNHMPSDYPFSNTPSEQTTIGKAPSSQEPAANNDTRIIVLDPGHGGTYPGASYQGFLEKDLTLKLAQYLKAYLEAHYEDISVYLTRNEDVQLSDSAKEDLEKRVDVASGLGAELLISLHFNTEPNAHSSAGALVCISKQPNVTDASRALADSILGQLEQLGISNRGPLLRDHDRYVDENGAALDYYAICRYSAAAGFPGIIVEHCFMDNPEELQFFGTDEALQRLAVADAAGIADYMGLTAK